MKDGWKEEEFECFVKGKDGFDIPVKGTFKCHYGDSVEAVLVSLKDGNGRNVDISEGEKERIEGECAWYKYKSEYGSVGLSREKKARVAVARQLVRIAKDLMRRD